jgi:hypothetical protein
VGSNPGVGMEAHTTRIFFEKYFQVTKFPNGRFEWIHEKNHPCCK